MPKKLLLLDLDGTIRETKSGVIFLNTPEDQKLINGAKEAIDRYHADGWIIVGISNQGGVAAGYKTHRECVKEQKITLKLAEHISRIYFCPDDGKTCWMVGNAPKWLPIHSVSRGIHKRNPQWNYRKPCAGMLLSAIDWFWDQYYPELSDSLLTGGDAAFGLDYGLFDVLYVGDRPEDEQAATSAKIPFRWNSEWIKE